MKSGAYGHPMNTTNDVPQQWTLGYKMQIEGIT